MILDSYADIYLENSKHLVEFKNSKITVDNRMFLELITSLSMKEYDFFTETLKRAKFNNERRRCFESDPYTKEMWEVENLRNIEVSDPVKLGSGNEDEWKFRYYSHHFYTSEHMDTIIGEMCNNYLEGISWVTKYYFEECTDWRWQYSYSHAPFISDLSEYFHDTEYDLNKISFKKRDPISPSIQLLAVLPPKCAHLIPISYKYLVSDPFSPVIDMFPEKVEVDMINKDQLWQCIPLVPALDENRIISAIINKDLRLTKEEEERNKIYSDLIYD